MKFAKADTVLEILACGDNTAESETPCSARVTLGEENAITAVHTIPVSMIFFIGFPFYVFMVFVTEEA
jgi:hypothetical protein